jgi:hypothetical protein
VDDRMQLYYGLTREDWYGRWDGPHVALIAGPMGSGKTRALGLAYHDAYWLGRTLGAFDPLIDLGLEPGDRFYEVRTLDDVLDWQYRVIDGELPWRPAALYDDASLIGQATDIEIHTQITGDPDVDFVGAQPFQFWGRMKRRTGQFMANVHDMDMHAFVSAHLVEPDLKKNMQTGRMEKTKGGVEMPGRAMSKAMSHDAFSVYLTRFQPDRLPWPWAFYCVPDPEWEMKDRLSIVRGHAPMNMGEIMRAAGYAVPRREGFEWMDEVADAVAKRILSGEDRQAVADAVIDALVAQNVANEDWASLAVADGQDRAEIRKRPRLRDLFRTSITKQTLGPAAGPKKGPAPGGKPAGRPAGKGPAAGPKKR